MVVKKEIKRIGADFFSGLRFGLGGFPSVLSPPYKKIKLKAKGKRKRR